VPGMAEDVVEDGGRTERLSGGARVGVALAGTLAVVAAVALLLVPYRWTGTETVTVNAYVVPSLGRDESFAAVAGRTVGDTERGDEIFALNRGRTQADGSVVEALGAPASPGWVLVLPADATGEEVQQAQTVRFKPYWTWPLVLSLAGAVVLGVITVLVVARRVVTDGGGRLWRALRGLPGAVRERARARAARVRVRRAMDTGLGAPEVAAAAVDEVAAGSDGGVHAVVHDAAGDLHVRVSPVGGPPAGWRSSGDGVWSRSGTPPALGAAGGTSLPVRVGAAPDGGVVLVDLARVQGVVAVVGDAAVARDLVAQMVRDAVGLRPGLVVTTLSADGRGPAVPPGVETGPDGEDGHAEHSGVAGLFVPLPGEGELTELVVVPFEPDPDMAAALVEAAARTGWAVLVEGEVAGAARRWHARRDGVVRLPELDLDLVVPVQAAPA